MKIIRLGVCIALLCLDIAAQVDSASGLQGDWWMFRHDPQHTGRSPFVGPDMPTKRWEFATGDSVWSSPAIGSDGTIYVGSLDNKLYAINPDGSKKWEFATGDHVSSSPAIGSGTAGSGASIDHAVRLADR